MTLTLPWFSQDLKHSPPAVILLLIPQIHSALKTAASFQQPSRIQILPALEKAGRRHYVIT